MNSRRSTLLLLDKIQRDWTAASLTPYLSPEVLDVVTEDLNRIESGTKVRVLLSLLTLKNTQELNASIVKLLKACEEEGSEDWVGVIAPLVQRQLPDLPNVSSSSTDASVNKFQEALDRIRKELLAVEPDPSTSPAEPKANGEKSKDASQPSFSLPASFLPLEFPYLSRSLLPKSLQVSGDRNRHFTAREHEKTLVVKYGNSDKVRRQPALPRATVTKKREVQTFTVKDDIRKKIAEKRGGAAIKVVDFAEMEKAREARAAKDAERIKSEKARKAKEARDASKSSKQANLNTPEGIKETLLNIVRGANKVTEEDKKVIENYLQGGENPDPKASNIKVILLNESRRFSDDKASIIVEQIKLKIDYANRTLKKVKGVKRFKLKT